MKQHRQKIKIGDRAIFYILLLLRLSVIGGIISLGALLSSQHLVFDLISHFRIQYIVLLFAFSCLAIYLKRYAIFAVLSICLAIHFYAVFQSLRPVEAISKNQIKSLTIMSSNLLASNDEYDSYIEFVLSVDPDVVVLQEYTTAWDAVLSLSLNDYPYRHLVPIDSHFGIAIYSKLPMVDKKIYYLTQASVPSIRVSFLIDGTMLDVLGTHLQPPISNSHYDKRNQQLKEISGLALGHEGAFVVAGDLNITPWSSHFHDFIEAGDLVDGRRGHGILPTWPAWFVPLQIPIDHIIVNKLVEVVSLNVSSETGSDHKSIWANLQLSYCAGKGSTTTNRHCDASNL